MIKKLTPSAASACASLHTICLPADTLSLFGITFLTHLYKVLFSFSDVKAYGFFDRKNLKGFIVGCKNSQSIFYGAIKQEFIPFSLLLLKRSFQNPQLFVRIIETFFYTHKQPQHLLAELLVIAIHPSSRKKGIGKNLVKKLQQALKQVNIRSFHVNVYAENAIANVFYQKLGGEKYASFRLYHKVWNSYLFASHKPDLQRSKQLSIILPTSNEAGNIQKLIKKITKECEKNHISFEIIVVDDNSNDDTAYYAKKLKIKQVQVYVRMQEKGLASAILYGIKKAKSLYVLVMDTDFNHDPKEIPVMFRLSHQADLIIGSRFIKNGGMENAIRNYLSKFFNLYLKILLGHSINDNLSGFFIIRRSLLKTLPLEYIFTGFGDFFMRLIYILHKQNKSLLETPVFYKNRTYGESKSKFIPMFISYSVSALKLRFANKLNL